MGISNLDPIIGHPEYNRAVAFFQQQAFGSLRNPQRFSLGSVDENSGGEAMIGSLEMAEDLLRAVGPNGRILPSDTAKKVAEFANCIHCSSQKESIQLLCLLHLLNSLYSSTGMTGFGYNATVVTGFQSPGPEGETPCPI